VLISFVSFCGCRDARDGEIGTIYPINLALAGGPFILDLLASLAVVHVAPAIAEEACRSIARPLFLLQD
jgi:hypothetical protein